MSQQNENVTCLRPYHDSAFFAGPWGDIELVDVADQEISVRLKGACVGCPLSFFTMTLGVEKQLKELFPQLQRVTVIE